ncbi:MAG: hypothetical protein ACREBG_06875, partial [Pyrinomonadaceae bacterium]
TLSRRQLQALIASVLEEREFRHYSPLGSKTFNCHFKVFEAQSFNCRFQNQRKRTPDNLKN